MRFPSTLNRVAVGIDLRAELRDDRPVDGDRPSTIRRSALRREDTPACAKTL
jgi:hypothetical protein